MKQKIVLIVSMMLCTTLSVAQVQEFQIGAQSNSIVRIVKGDSVLVYTEVSPTEAYFLLYVDGDASAQAFQLLPGYNVQVRDVRIHNGETAYFCGTMGSGLFINNFAAVGQFNIADIFSGTGQILWTFFPDWMGHDGLMVTDLKRLDLVKCHDTVCMAMTGKSLYGYGIALPSTTVASAWIDDSFNWHLNAHTNRYLKMTFTDVTCMNRMILAVGSSLYDTGCYVKPFHVTPDFPAHPVATDIMWGLSYGSPVGEILARRMTKDSVVIAHFDNSSGVGVVFHLLSLNSSGVPSVPTKTWKTVSLPTSVYGTGQKLKELNSVGETAFLLHTNEYPLSGYPAMLDWVLALNYNNYTLSPAPIVYTPLKMWQPPLGKIHSMDAGAASMRLSANNYTSLATYGPHPLWENPCFYPDSAGPLYSTAGSFARDIVDETVSDTVSSLFLVPELFQVDVNTICNPKGKEQEQ